MILAFVDRFWSNYYEPTCGTERGGWCGDENNNGRSPTTASSETGRNVDDLLDLLYGFSKFIYLTDSLRAPTERPTAVTICRYRSAFCLSF